MCELLPAVGPAPFARWAATFLAAVAAASRRLPRLSGFYHLLTCGMCLAVAGGLLNEVDARCKVGL